VKKENDKPSKKEEDWMSKKWRPMMAIMYMMVCIFDFILFPIMFTAVQFWETQAANDAFRQWNPLTLLGGGLFHVAMGAVLGVSAWSRGQEKIAGVANNNATPQLSAPVAGPTTFGVAAPATNSWGSQPLGGGSSFGSVPAPTNSFAAAPVGTGWGGKKAPPEPEYPVIG
jgi:hypothetical protein